jgi:hypothetical protein
MRSVFVLLRDTTADFAALVGKQSELFSHIARDLSTNMK